MWTPEQTNYMDALVYDPRIREYVRMAPGVDFKQSWTPTGGTQWTPTLHGKPIDWSEIPETPGPATYPKPRTTAELSPNDPLVHGYGDPSANTFGKPQTGGPQTGGGLIGGGPQTGGPQTGGGYEAPQQPWVPGENVDTSWNWDAFAPEPNAGGQWGGYDPGYDAFERYVPGRDSPWGSAKYEGDNDAFYQQQLANALRQEQGYMNRMRESQRRAGESAQNPKGPMKMDWSWAFGGKGLPDVNVSPGTPGGAEQGGWQRNPYYGITPGMTNSEILGAIGHSLSPADQARWQKHGRQNENFNNSKYWSSFDNPTDFMNAMRQNNPKGGGGHMDYYQNVANLLFTQAGEPVAGQPHVPAGYASPFMNWGGAK